MALIFNDEQLKVIRAIETLIFDKLQKICMELPFFGTKALDYAIQKIEPYIDKMEQYLFLVMDEAGNIDLSDLSDLMDKIPNDSIKDIGKKIIFNKKKEV